MNSNSSNSPHLQVTSISRKEKYDMMVKERAPATVTFLPTLIKTFAHPEKLANRDLILFSRKVTPALIFYQRRTRQQMKDRLEDLKRKKEFFETATDMRKETRQQCLRNIAEHMEEINNLLLPIPALPTLDDLYKKNPQKCELYVARLITLLCGSLNIGKNLTPGQIPDTALELIISYSTLTLEDLVLCFRNITNGTYGDLYDVLDQAKLLLFVKRYLGEVQELVRREQEQQSNNETPEFSKAYLAPAEPVRPLNEAEVCLHNMKSLQQLLPAPDHEKLG